MEYLNKGDDMTIDQLPIQHIREWTNLSADPPIDESEALRWLDSHLHEEVTLPYDIISRLYGLIAYDRLKRSHINHETIAKEFVQQGKTYTDSDPILYQIEEMLDIISHYSLIESSNFTSFMLHEADHQSVKRKKLQAIEQKVEALEEDWTTHSTTYPSSKDNYSTSILIKCFIFSISFVFLS